MKHLRNILTLVILLAVIAVAVLFSIQNTSLVPLDLLVYAFEPRSLALWVLLAFAIGGVAGMLMSFIMLVRTRTALGHANRQLGKARAELAQLRPATPPVGN